MTGRGIDQVLPHPGDPTLHEPYCHSALDYVQLAERLNGPIPRPVAFPYIWGRTIDDIRRLKPDAKLINLETAVTVSDDFDREKDIHYRMSPQNVDCLTAASIDCCSLANNHVLDWGQAGLLDTVDTLSRKGIAAIGAGRNFDEATSPAKRALPSGGRVLFFACGCRSSGILDHWAATASRPGVWLLDELAPSSVNTLTVKIRSAKRQGDLVVLSIHWGDNWGYDVPREQQQFAHDAIDRAGVDLVHGHSSHHVKGIEVYQGRLILYGCGDLLTDYEGIRGREDFRDDLGLLYFATLDPASDSLVRLDMVPTLLNRFRLTAPSPTDVRWLAGVLDREGVPLGTSVELRDNQLCLRWHKSMAPS